MEKRIVNIKGESIEIEIGGELFPLNNSKIITFNSDSTSDEFPKKDKLLLKLSQHSFTTGKCFDNTEFVVEIAKRMNLKPKYYAGWVFAMTSMPVFHCWCVIGKAVIDVSIDIFALNTLQETGNIRKGENEADYKLRLATAVKDKREVVKPGFIERYTFGKVPTFLNYIGCETTKFSAKKLLQQLFEKHPIHPSYLHRAKRDAVMISGRTELQKLLD